MRFLHRLIVFSFLLIPIGPAWAQVYWGNKAGGASIEQGLAIATDNNGNTYAAGYFTGTCNFGGSTSLTATGLSDIYVIKYNNLGVQQWVQKYGGPNDERARGIVVDNTGNIFLTGHFTGTTTIGSTNLVSNGLDDALIIKLDNSGAVLWARSGGGTGPDLGYDVACDGAGNAVITGEIFNTATFGANVLNGVNEDVFIAKYNAAGTLQWTQLGTATHVDKGYGVACDAAGNVYVCGQFSDTITFDVAHNTTFTNLSFLIQLDPAGNEQWFRYMGGGSLCIAYDLDLYGSDVYVTGDFTGNMNFYGTAIPALTNTYTNRIFLASYTQSGNGNWAKADGSNSNLTCRSVEVNSSGAYIAGHFKCTLDDYADVYGEGVFNSVGYYDCFLTRYSLAGQRQWMRQWGGNKNDFCWDLAIDAAGEPVMVGEYEAKFNVPIMPATVPTMYNTSNVFCGGIAQANNYCNDNNYNRFAFYYSVGNYDVFVGRLVDPLREPYDFYQRYGSACLRPQVEPCIEGAPMYDCPDTVTYCGSGYLGMTSYANANQCIGPDYTYSFVPANYYNITTSGLFVSTSSRVDGCYSWTDSIYVVINPVPALPLISDELLINVLEDTTIDIHVCADSVLIWGNGHAYGNYQWIGYTPQDSSLMVTVSGAYTFSVTNAQGCTRINNVTVYLEDSLSLLPDLGSICPQDSDLNDTLVFCYGDMASFDVLDTVSGNTSFMNWQGLYNLYYPNSTVPVQDSITGNAPDVTFTPDSSGWYVIEMFPEQANTCDTMQYSFTDSVYIHINPLPNLVLTLTPGSIVTCIGDTVLFTGSSSMAGVPLTWAGGTFAYPVSNDSVWVICPGNVSISATYTDSLGCTANGNASAVLSPPPTPSITATSLIICPGDSVLLVCSNSPSYISFQWYGPQGPLPATNDSLYVNGTPGFYYCAVFDSLGCNLYSNSLEIVQYSIPDLFVTPDNVVCPGQDSVVIHVTYPLGAIINWLPPLSGSDTVQVITQPGTYICQFTTCNITVVDSITITSPNSSLTIAGSGSLFFCTGDSVLLTALDSATISGISWQPVPDIGNSTWVFTTGNYTATGTDAWGCLVTSNVLSITANTDPTPEPIVQDVEFCPQDSVTFQASGSGQIYWYYAINDPAPMATGPTYTTPLLSVTTSYFVDQLLDSCMSPRIEVKALAVQCDSIPMPNVFTPNGDGFNDWVDFNLLDATCFEISIYNRWGYEVFRTTDPTIPWLGLTETGAPLSEGVYYYVLHYCPKNVPPKTQTGFIHLFQ